MRICFDYRIFGIQKYGGISRYFVELASRIHRFPDAEVRVIAPLYRSNFLAAQRNAIPITGVHYSRTIPKFPRLVSRLDFLLSRPLIFAFRPQILHETYYSHRRISSVSEKTVLTVYDMIEELFPQFFPLNETTIKIRSAAFARADHLICISESTRADLIKIYGVDAHKVSVVHLASSIHMSRLPPISVGVPFFLYVGDRLGYKNFIGFLEAFHMSQLYKTHKVLCFGGGELNAMEREALAKLGIPRDRIVVLTGDDELLARCYAGAEAFVYPSLYEGFGIPLLEAMACDCPVLCSDSSSMPEVAGDAAIYFSAPDTGSISLAMLRIAGSPRERSQMISKGRERVQNFSWDTCAQQTHDIYKRLLSN